MINWMLENISSAGVLLAFHFYRLGINVNDYCILSAFGAGYAVGSILLKKID